jgi:hypothetical protein
MTARAYKKGTKVHHNERIPGEFVDKATVGEILASAGIQLIHWAHDLAFTDAAFGEAWAVEQANRMASLSEILNVAFKRLPKRSLEILVDFPVGMTGQIAINPDYKKDSAPSGNDVPDEAASTEGIDHSIDDLPF